MSCKINFKKKPVRWNIKLKNENILKSLYKRNEFAGRFQFELKNNKMISSMINLKEGNSSSVETIPGLVNFHTHPFSCYNDEKCIFGSPSGEDMRELIRFGLQGNLCHLIFALEGVYVIQVNPCYLKILKEKSFKINEKIKGDTARGVVAYFIEMYFKSTHGHRSIEYNNFIKKQKGVICQPKDWVNFANNFKLSNFFSKKNKCSKKLPCNGIPEYSKSICPLKYIEMYGTSGQFTLNTKGDAYEFGKYRDVASELLKKDFNKLVKIFKEGCNKGSSIVWNSEQWFYVKFFPNKFKIDKTFVIYENLIRKLNNNPEKIFDYWKKCQKEKNNISFNEKKLPYIEFHPLEKPNCKIRLGKEMLTWINGTGDKKLTKKNLKT